MNGSLRRVFVLAAFAFLAVALSACRPASTPTPLPTPTPSPIEFATIAELEAECSTIQDRPVMIRGELDLPNLFTNCYTTGDRRCLIYLMQSERRGDYIDRDLIEISIQQGEGNNQMEELPGSYKASDLKVHTETGEVVGDGDLVTVIGWANDRCNRIKVMTVTRLSSPPTPTPLPPIEFATIAELRAECDTVLDQDRQVMISGELRVPSGSASISGWGSIYLDDDSDTITIWIREGEGNNQMEPLPNFFEESDLKVHTETGEIVGDGDLVTIIGVLELEDPYICDFGYDAIYVVQIR